jgi:hypothetical protein
MKYTQFVAIAKNVTSRALSPLKPHVLRLILHRLFNRALGQIGNQPDAEQFEIRGWTSLRQFSESLRHQFPFPRKRGR